MSELRPVAKEPQCLSGKGPHHHPLGPMGPIAKNPVRSLNERFSNINLGHGRDDVSPEDAAETFLKQEYPGVADGDQTKPILIPDFFLSKYSEEVDYRRSAKRSKLSDKLDGEETERKCCEMFQEFFSSKECKQKYILLFHGLENNPTITLVQPKLEIDFIIVCLELRSIFLIECKNKASTSSCTKAYNQHKLRKRFLENNFNISPDWQVIRCFFYSKTEGTFCNACTDFTLHPEQNIEEWWDKIVRDIGLKRLTSKEDDPTYYNLARDLVFYCHSYMRCATPAAVSARAMKQLEKNICTLSNRMAWSDGNGILLTKDQLRPLLSNKRRVFLTSDFGTGKTLLLQEKCIEVANKNPQDTCYFIVMPAILFAIGDIWAQHCLLSTLVEISSRLLFQRRCKHKNVKVTSWAELSSTNSKRISDLEGVTREALSDFVYEEVAEGKSTKHFFIDEYHTGHQKLRLGDGDYVDPYTREKISRKKISRMDAEESGKNVLELSEILANDSYLWVANNSDFNNREYKDRKIIEGGFEMPTLVGNMRSCAHVTKATGRGKDSKWDNYPTGRPPKFLNINISALKNAEIHSALSKAMEHLHEDTENLGILTDDLSFVPHIQTFFSKEKYPDAELLTYVHDRRLTEPDDKRDKDVETYFKNNRKGVMLTDMYLAQGAEFRNTIVFCSLDRRERLRPYFNEGRRVQFGPPFLTRSNMVLRAVVGTVIIRVPHVGHIDFDQRDSIIDHDSDKDDENEEQREVAHLTKREWNQVRNIELTMELKKKEGLTAAVHSALAEAMLHLKQDKRHMGILTDDAALVPHIQTFFSENRYRDIKLFTYVHSDDNDSAVIATYDLDKKRKGTTLKDRLRELEAHRSNIIEFCRVDKRGNLERYGWLHWSFVRTVIIRVAPSDVDDAADKDGNEQEQEEIKEEFDDKKMIL